MEIKITTRQILKVLYILSPAFLSLNSNEEFFTIL